MRRWACRSSAAVLPLASTLLLCGAAHAADEAQTETARWVPKELHFTYSGFTTHFSCEGLESRVKQILLQLGARPDLSVHQFGCTQAAGVPATFPSVEAKFSVLEPVSASGQQGSGGTSPTVAAQWQTVQLKLDPSPLAESGLCEFIDQVKVRILPLFATRNVEYMQHCVPHQLSSRGSTIKLDVMKAPLKQADNAPAS
jgi:hypothetical protein